MRNRVEQKAHRLLQQHGVQRPPVPIEDLVSRLGIQLAAEPLDSEVSAMLYRKGGRALILVNKNHPPVRQRFSVAHELGHFLLHGGEVFIDKRIRVDFRDSKSSLGVSREEIQANRFAAELLMPEELLVAEVGKLRKRESDISANQLIAKLAKVFEVSRLAIQHRLTNLGLSGTF